MNSQTDQQTSPYPWYDDRVKDLCQSCAEPRADHKDGAQLYATLKKTYTHLSAHVWKQEETKKAASIIMYNCFHGIKSNAMFVDPSGCGKTHEFAQDGTIFNVHFEGLDGFEPVRSVKEALDLMKIENPAVAFSEDIKAGIYNDVSDEDYKLMLDAVKCVSSLWQYKGAPPDKKKEFQMNPPDAAGERCRAVEPSGRPVPRKILPINGGNPANPGLHSTGQ